MNYIPITEEEKEEMLKRIGVKSIDELFSDIPTNLKMIDTMNIPDGVSEYEVRKKLIGISEKNKGTNHYMNFMGSSVYNHYVPTLVDALISRSEFYTAYTPYQPEISQGTLQSIYEFQTMVCEMFGMDISNASVYDGATALSEAVIMLAEKKKRDVIISEGVFPEYINTLKTYVDGVNIDIKTAYLKGGITQLHEYEEQTTDTTAAYVVQYPNYFGTIEDIEKISELAKEKKVHLIVVMGDVTSLGILEAPGNLGADVVVGDGLPFAGPLVFSGPNIGWIAVTKKLGRKIPGRIAGLTVDAEGKEAYVLTMQAREQHIRREKAISNICSNQALYALANNITLSTLGQSGLRAMAENSLSNAHYAAKKICEIEGVSLMNDQPFYSEFAVKLPMKAAVVKEKMIEKGILGPVYIYETERNYDDIGLFFVNELRSKEEIDYLVKSLEEVLNGK